MAINALKSLAGMLAVVICLFAAPIAHGADEPSEQAGAEPAVKVISNKRCMRCHGDEDEKTAKRPDGTEINIFVDKEVFGHSVHAKQLCVGCHNNITELPHDEPLPKRVGCTECHEKTWAEQKNNPDPEYKRLGVVMQQIDGYMHSVHAKPNKLDGTRVNATCVDCHQAHNIGSLGSSQRADHRLKNPEVCGRCHEKEKEVYLASVHGKALMEKKDAKSAVCSDCHSTHNIASPKGNAMKLAITQNCGNCHTDAQKTYFASYHGQVNRLGYTHTAKCYDCHGGHDLKGINDPTSSVHKNNRLKTCNTCHKDAPENFLGFHAHGNAHDFDKYPGIWITAKFMQALIIGVFLFFWTHVILWLHREYKDRQQGKGYMPDPTRPETVYFRRFTATWRLVHLLFAVSTMILVMTGTTLLFSHTAWAQTVIGLLGGPKVEAIIHRTAATTWLSVFLFHFVTAVLNIWRHRKTFQWFGPTSLVPNMQDLRDVGAMFSWFIGRSPRPSFDRWSYWQKFDYWAPFWGAAIIGFSGLMLFFPTKTAIFLPGWVFNIATIVHAEEALLATMFLFSVHFFNVHFRPDKFPMSTTIFTGTVPLEEFKHEHKLEYERLLASGELDKYLVNPPTRRVVTGSKVLAAILIFAGLSLLALVLIGYITMP
ncbi:MAG: cytochrome C [Pseudomonadota bacterium]|nr:cytochrome C [Pseudomonadota bacterium]